MNLFPEALEDLNKAIQMQPGWAFYHCNRTELFLLMGNIEQALNDLKTTYKLSKNLVESPTLSSANI